MEQITLGGATSPKKEYFYLVWVLSLTATFGSLFFSEVMKLPPCVLCWYQRIAMYPIALLLPLALVRNETRVIAKYALALALVGLAVATYHNLLYYGIVPESIAPCKEGISCTSRQIEWFGFITIPLLSLAAFSAITLILCVERVRRIKV